MPTRPFDAVLLVSFGGPERPADIRPFLQNVLRGRRIPPARLEEVAHHYELFGGVSPLTEFTRRQAAGLEARLRARGLEVPVHIGMRNWHPFLVDTLREMGRRGIRRALAFPTAAHRTYSSCGQYKQNVLQAREELKAEGAPDVSVAYVGDWFTHPGFIAANADHVREAFARLPAGRRAAARLVFTAHSIPHAAASVSPYEAQIRESARLVAESVGVADWALVFQSRSGRPEDPWLEPDVNDYLREARARGLEAVVLCPIGFICDHVEVLYDLDVEARQTADAIGLTLERAESVNDDAHFVDMMADVVAQTMARYEGGRPLTIVSAAAPNATELPPPYRHRPVAV